jgi:hypothetical protein
MKTIVWEPEESMEAVNALSLFSGLSIVQTYDTGTCNIILKIERLFSFY